MSVISGVPRLVWPAGAVLGEAPVWDDAERLLYWLDIEGKRLHRTDADGRDRRSWSLPERVGCLALTDTPDTVLLGLESGLHLFRPGPGEGGALDLIARPDPGGPDLRPNDCAVDGAGRLWFGTMHVAQREGEGALHVYEGGAECRCVARGWTIPNGPAIAPDERWICWTDSPRRTVFAFDLAEGPALENQRPFLRLDDDVQGVPDGMTFDAEGCLWVALNGGGAVLRLGPDGNVRETLRLPAPEVSSCAFGGEGLHTLFVTTAREGISDEQRTEADGALFAIETRTQGLPARRLRTGRPPG